MRPESLVLVYFLISVVLTEGNVDCSLILVDHMHSIIEEPDSVVEKEQDA